MKKTLALLLAALMLCALLPAASLAEEPEYTYTVAPYTIGPLGEKTPIIDFMNEHYHVKFEMIYLENSNADAQINLLAASDELPDVFAYGDEQMLLEQGMIGTWTEEFFREHMPKYSAMIDEYIPLAWSLCKKDGMMYTLPGMNYEYLAAPDVCAWNRDWLDKLEVSEIPTDLDGMVQLMYRIAKEDPDGNGAADTYGLSTSGMTAIYGAYGFQRGKWLDDGSGNVVRGDVMPKAKEALALLNRLYKDGVLDPEFITGENQGGYWALSHAFINQRIGLSCLGRWYHWADLTELGLPDMGPNPEAIAQSAHPFKVTYSQPPEGPYGDCGTNRNDAAKTKTTFSTRLVEDTPRFARLLDIIEDLNMDPMMTLTKWYGIEGEHWEFEEINGVKTVHQFGNNAPAEEGGGNWFNWTPGSVYYWEMRIARNKMFLDKYLSGWTDKYYENAVPQKLPSAPLYLTECDKIVNEGYIAIITGEKPVDFFDEMVQNWYNAGGQILTDEANEIYHQR